jgi:CheY-like chemotaxis protein
VSDTGCGMSADTMAHLFEPFFTTKERGKGTGLGLSIVYGIVEQCGGDVWVESEPGRGTKVFVCLPLADADRRAKSGAGDGGDGRPGSEFVLLVEDEDPVRELVRDMLEMAGYRVHAASGGPEALEWAQDPANDFDLLVSDVVMPRMNGGELAERLRHLRGELRVLFVSGYPDDAIVRHGVRESGAPFLQKPFTYQMLTEKVREVLDTSFRRAA